MPPIFDVVDDPTFIAASYTPRRKPTQSRQQRLAAAQMRRMVARKKGQAPDPKDIPEEADFAQTVTKLTMKAMREGKVEPTVRDGLQAQALLDKRAEKAEDRRFMLNLARALAGGGLGTPELLLPEPMKDASLVIEGEYEESLLAPAHLREG